MTRRQWAVLAIIALLPVVISWLWVVAPGYTDAEYYMATAQRLATGHGLTEPFVWNYLAGAQPIPHPSHLYWMPLTTIVAALPMSLAGATFRIGQLPFLLMAISLPLVSARLTLYLGGTDRHAMLAGILGSLPGFYLPFLLTTDAFALYALVGTGVLLSLSQGVTDGRLRWSWAAGVCIGLAHLTRADGLIFALPAVWALTRMRARRRSHVVAMVVGYALVAGPWMIRMLWVSGSPLPPGAGRALWLNSYDELFSYPASMLTAAALFANGLWPVLAARLSALAQNLGALLMVNGLVFLGPFMLWGGWRHRQKPLVPLATIYLAGLVLTMSFAFPYPGTRGGLFHSSSALMPTLWSLAALGLHDAIHRLATWRGWAPARSVRMFTAGAVLISATATGFLLWVRLAAPAANGLGWGGNLQDYRQIGDRLTALGGGVEPVVVNDPPGYWLATQQQAVVIPNGGVHVLGSVVHVYDAGWVLLDANRPAGLADLYANPRSLGGLTYVETVQVPKLGSVRLFRAEAGP